MGQAQTAGGWPGFRAAVRHPDAPLYVVSTITGFSAVWFALSLWWPGLPAPIGWAPAVLAEFIAAVATVTAIRRVTLPAARRFWRQLAVAVVLVGIGTALRAAHAIDGMQHKRVETPEMVIFTVAMLVIVWALLRLPLGIRGPRQAWTFILDACTVLAAALLFMWHFSIRLALQAQQDDPSALVSALVANVLTMCAVFALVKVALTGAATVDRRALRMLGIGLVVGSLGSSPETLLPPGAPSLSQIVTPLSAALFLAGLRWQSRNRAHRMSTPTEPDDATARRGRRRLSVMPYIAAAAANALLVMSVARDGWADRVTVAAGVVLIAVLVIIRQVLAFRDNSRLLDRLDESLERLAERERRFRSLVQHASDLITVTNPDGRFGYASPGAWRVLGLGPEELVGRPAVELVHPDDLDTARAQFERIKDSPGAATTYQVRLAHADGGWRWVEVTTANLLHDPGIAGIVGNARDVTDARDLQQRLHHQATHDGLTELANRTLFGRRLGDALGADRAGSLWVLLIDLNEFKTVNDTLGHAAGDALLTTAARRLAGAVRTGDTVARLGGDEFAVLIDAATDADVTAVLDSIAEAFADPVVVDGHPLPIAASVGVAPGRDVAGLADGPDAAAEELLRRADIAMYAAKARRGGPSTRHAHYVAEMDARLSPRPGTAPAADSASKDLSAPDEMSASGGVPTGAPVRQRSGSRSATVTSDCG
jgi:diguanylate cyclase (GGDEF)-like protein/PAS domain S-box-containing protein